MKKSNFKLIWIPNVLLLFFALFLLIFSFDVFGGPEPIWEQILGFIMHSIPSIILLVLLFVSRKRPAVGMYSFLLMFGIFTLFFNTTSDIIVFLIISMPLMIVSFLYMIVCYRGKFKKYKLNIFIIILVFIGIIMTGYNTQKDRGENQYDEERIILTDDEQVIQFEDKVFERVIREYLNLENEEIKWKDIGYEKDIFLEEIEISENIMTLEDMKWFVNLEYLNMSDQPVFGDIGNLSVLENIDTIFVEGTNVVGDISSLSEMKNLEYINIEDTYVRGDIGSLSNLEKLIELNVDGSLVTGKLTLKNGEVIEVEK